MRACVGRRGFVSFLLLLLSWAGGGVFVSVCFLCVRAHVALARCDVRGWCARCVMDAICACCRTLTGRHTHTNRHAHTMSHSAAPRPAQCLHHVHGVRGPTYLTKFTGMKHAHSRTRTHAHTRCCSWKSFSRHQGRSDSNLSLLVIILLSFSPSLTDGAGDI